MNRRAFIRGLLASGAAVVVAPIVSIAPPVPTVQFSVEELRNLLMPGLQIVAGSWDDVEAMWLRILRDA